MGVAVGAGMGERIAEAVGPGVAVGADVGDAAGEGPSVTIGVLSGRAQDNPATKSASGTRTTSLIITWLLCPFCQIHVGVPILDPETKRLSPTKPAVTYAVLPSSVAAPSTIRRRLLTELFR